jgi:hypothetical protein
MNDARIRTVACCYENNYLKTSVVIDPEFGNE